MAKVARKITQMAMIFTEEKDFKGRVKVKLRLVLPPIC